MIAIEIKIKFRIFKKPCLQKPKLTVLKQNNKAFFDFSYFGPRKSELFLWLAREIAVAFFEFLDLPLQLVFDIGNGVAQIFVLTGSAQKLATDMKIRLGIKNLAGILRDGADGYARLMTLEMGKPITQSKTEIEK